MNPYYPLVTTCSFIAMSAILFFTKSYWIPSDSIETPVDNLKVRSLTKITTIPDEHKIEFASPMQKKFLRKQHNINEYYAELKAISILSEEDKFDHEHNLNELIDTIYSCAPTVGYYKNGESYKLWQRQKLLYYKKINFSIKAHIKDEVSSAKLSLEDIHNVKVKFLNTQIDSLLNSY